MTDQEIKRLDLCFIWTRTYFNLFSDKAAEKHPFGFFAKISMYKKKFKKLHKDASYQEALSLPWEKKHPSSFWKHYFRQVNPWDVSANKAWDVYQVPLRKRIRADVSTSWLADKKAVFMEGFFYRHGVAAVITIRIRDSASLDEAKGRALQARFSGTYHVKWSESSKDSFSLNGLAQHLLNSFCNESLGLEEEKGADFSGDPFSIAAVIQGGSEYRDRLVKQGDIIHKTLEALVNWNEAWPGADPPKLADKMFSIKNKQDNHYLYGDQHGRAIWFPKLFSPPLDGSKIYALRWYFRNLVLASVQTASLGAFVHHTADRLRSGATITTYQTNWVRHSIDALERLRKEQNTYRTWSTHAQIEQNGILEDMNYLKTKL